MVKITNQKQSSKDSIPIYLYITTRCVRPWHFAPSTQKFSSFSQGKQFPGYFKIVMTRYVHLRSQLFLLKPIPWNSVRTSLVKNLTTTTTPLWLDHLPQMNAASCRMRVLLTATRMFWPAVDGRVCGGEEGRGICIFGFSFPCYQNLKQSSKLRFRNKLWCPLALLSM